MCNVDSKHRIIVVIIQTFSLSYEIRTITLYDMRLCGEQTVYGGYTQAAHLTTINQIRANFFCHLLNKYENSL